MLLVLSKKKHFPCVDAYIYTETAVFKDFIMSTSRPVYSLWRVFCSLQTVFL